MTDGRLVYLNLGKSVMWWQPNPTNENSVCMLFGLPFIFEHATLNTWSHTKPPNHKTYLVSLLSEPIWQRCSTLGFETVWHWFCKSNLEDCFGLYNKPQWSGLITLAALSKWHTACFIHLNVLIMDSECNIERKKESNLPSCCQVDFLTDRPVHASMHNTKSLQSR